MRSPEFRAELARRQEILAGAANVMTAEVIGFLASRMRADIADILPDVEVIKKAREKGISHWIKEYEETTTHKADGSKETRVKLKMVDADKSTALLSKILGLEFRDDAKDRARNAIRGIMALNQCSPHEAIVILAPHNPLVVTLRDEFENNPLLVESK